MIGYKSALVFFVAFATTLEYVSSCRVAYNTDYLGCDIGHSFEDTWEACATACSKFNGCLYWTWGKLTHPHVPRKCHFKNSKCKIVPNDVRLISGDRACVRPIPPQTCNVDHDIDYLGCDIGFSHTETWRECAEGCERKQGCEFWTWVKPTSNFIPKKCHYKNKKCDNVRSNNNLVSGNKACGTPCQVDHFTDYLGCDIGHTFEASWQDCAKACDRTNGCEYFTYSHHLSYIVPTKCHLKNKKCNVTPGRNFLTSGNKACAEAPYTY